MSPLSRAAILGLALLPACTRTPIPTPVGVGTATVNPEESFAIYTRPYPLGAHGVATLPPHVRFTAMPHVMEVDEEGSAELDDRITIAVADESDAFLSLMAKIEPASARALLAELNDTIRLRADRDVAVDAPAMNIIYGTLPYKRGPYDEFVLPDGVHFRVLPRYHGIDEAGEKFVDDRLTVVVEDETNSFFAVVARFDPPLAQDFRDNLAAAIEAHEGGAATTP